MRDELAEVEPAVTMRALEALRHEQVHAAYLRFRERSIVAVVGIAIERRIERVSVRTKLAIALTTLSKVIFASCRNACRTLAVVGIGREPRENLLLVSGSIHLDRRIAEQRNQHVLLDRRDAAMRPGERRVVRDVRKRHRIAMMLLACRAGRGRGASQMHAPAGDSSRTTASVRRQSHVVEQTSTELDLLARHRIVGWHDRLRKSRRQFPLVRRSRRRSRDSTRRRRIDSSMRHPDQATANELCESRRPRRCTCPFRTSSPVIANAAHTQGRVVVTRARGVVAPLAQRRSTSLQPQANRAAQRIEASNSTRIRFG